MRKLHSRSLKRVLLLTVMVRGFTVPAVAAQETPKLDSPKPAEETRLNVAVFRAGLKKRGLTELLELHLKDFPPPGPTESSLMLRDVKLAEYADPTLRVEQRREALAEANRMLTQVIEDNPSDARRLDWLFTLAHSLLYDQAEPFFAAILYRGGTATDRENLAALSARAVTLTRALLVELATEYGRVDQLSVEEFDKLERRGYVDRLDRLMPQGEYLLLWTLFYDSLPRDESDAVRTGELNEILGRLSDKPVLLDRPHETSRVQVQTLLLAGMTNRALNKHQPAREFFGRACTVAEQLSDPEEQQRVQWAVDLAWLERIRNDRDDGRFDEALAHLKRFRERLAARTPESFGLRIVAALLEQTIHRRQADAAEGEGKTAEARRFREQAWQSLAKLAEREPRRRDELYAAVYETVGPQADPAKLDPFEQCALIAGLLFDASSATGDAESLLDRAVQVGERFVAQPPPGAQALVPEVLYNIGVAEYRRGRPAVGAGRFLEVARDHTAFSAAPQAAAIAAQLAAGLFNDPSLPTRADLQTLYRSALEVLLTQYPDTDAARYWRFHYAQLLEEVGEYDAAATQYAAVQPEHEQYLESLFFQARCAGAVVEKISGQSGVEPALVQRRADEFFALQRNLNAQATLRLGQQTDGDAVKAIRALLARARLLAAEVQVLPRVDRPAQALETLAGFEDEHPAEAALSGRVWRVRLLAYQSLGRLDEAAQAIPRYIAADPDRAGPMLQSLYADLAADADKLRERNDTAAAQRKADTALLLAEKVNEWTAQSHGGVSDSQLRAAAVQLAEAVLRAGQYNRALDLFEPLFRSVPDGGAFPGEADMRIAFGRAEALFQLGRHESALPEFTRLATRLPPADSVRWRALLRDLQCRTSLNHPPHGIIKVIEQQKYLYPDLGGPLLAPEFERLRRENERRADSP